MRTKTKRLFLAFLCLVAFSLQAQNQEVADSLKQVLHTVKDSLKINTLTLLSEAYIGLNIDSALYYGEQAYALSKQLDYPLGMAESLSKRGIALEYQGKYKQAIPLYQEAIAIAQAHQLDKMLNPIYTNLALAHKALGDFPKALEYHFQALGISEKLQDSSDMAVSLNNIGNVYSFRENYAEGLKYYLEAEDVLDELNQREFLSFILNNIGIIYSIQGKYDDALDYHKRSLALKRKLRLKNGEATSLNNIGNLLRDQQKYRKAVPYLQKALSIYQETENRHKLPVIYRDLAEVYQKIDTIQALRYANRSLAGAEAIGKKNDIKEAYLQLSEIYALQNRYEQAYQYHQKFNSLKDSLFNEKKSQQIAELQTRYQTEKKEKEIALLAKQKARVRLRFFLAVGGLGAALLLGLLLVNWQRLKIRKNRQVYQTRQELTQTELENAHLKEQELQQKLDFKRKELTTHALNLVQKNGIMRELKEKINRIMKRSNGSFTDELKGLKRLVDYNVNLDKDWEEFSMYFEQVHKDFYTNLLEAYPKLTAAECRLCALIKLNLTIKEAAAILGISPSSVKMARYRLRKKLGLCTEDNLTEFIIHFDKKATAAAEN